VDAPPVNAVPAMSEPSPAPERPQASSFNGELRRRSQPPPAPATPAPAATPVAPAPRQPVFEPPPPAFEPPPPFEPETDISVTHLAPEPPAPPPTPAPAVEPVGERRAQPYPPSEGIRLLATQMAVAGSTQAEIEERLRIEFGVVDADAILYEVFGGRV
jgi:hypothetical protein